MLKVQVPATTGNLGPGFDTMGMAFNLYNYVSIRSTPGQLKICVQGEGKGEISRGKENIVYQAVKKVFKKINFHPEGLYIELENQIPVTRGLGSSASIIVGGMLAANFLTGERLTRDEILEMAVEMEGHPDNVAPALLGGMIVAVPGVKNIDYIKINPPEDLRVVVAVPDFQLPTKLARQAVPDQVSLRDAVFNIGHASLMAAALLKGDLELFGKMMEDKVHQPYRMHLIPGISEVFSAAKKAGALSAAISGAGPSLIAFTRENGEEIASAMESAFCKHGITSRIMFLRPEQNGAQVVSK